MTSSVSLLFAALLAGGLFAWFLHLERTGRGAIVVLTILGLVVVEVVVYESQNFIPSGLFHPGGGGITLRLEDAVIPIAFAARLLGRPVGRRIDVTSFWWIIFLVWMTAAGVMGYEAGNSRTFIAYEAKAIMYIGVFVLAASVRPEEYFAHRRLERFLYAAASLAALVTITDRAKIRVDIHNPLLPLVNSGAVSADSGTVLGSLGVIALVLALCRERHRLGLMLASAPLLYATLICGQRAAVLGLAASIALFVALGATRPQRLKTTPTEVMLVLLVIGGLYLLPPFIHAAEGSSATHAPLVGTIESTFGGQANELSAESRVDQWKAARIIIAEHPLLGSGLGTTYRFWDPGPQEFLETNLTHEIFLDLWLRTGVIGLALFAIAATLTVRGGIRVWWRCSDAAVASLALGMTAVFVGLLSKGLVESLFEKYRLATFIGLVVGMLCSTFAAVEWTHNSETAWKRVGAVQWS